jgi:hypothetical protein
LPQETDEPHAIGIVDMSEHTGNHHQIDRGEPLIGLGQ